MVLRKVCPTRCVCVGLKSDQRGIKVGFLPRKPTLMRIWWEIDGRRIAPTCVPRESRRASNRPFTHTQPALPKQPHPHPIRDGKRKSPLPQLYTAPYTEAQEILRRATPPRLGASNPNRNPTLKTGKNYYKPTILPLAVPRSTCTREHESTDECPHAHPTWQPAHTPRNQ